MAQCKKIGSSKINTDTTYELWEIDCDSCMGNRLIVPDIPYNPKPISVYIDDHSVDDLLTTRNRILRKTRLVSETNTTLHKFVLQRNTHISFETYILNNYTENIEYNGQLSVVKKHHIYQI